MSTELHEQEGDARSAVSAAQGSQMELFHLMAWRWNVSEAKKLTAGRTGGGSQVRWCRWSVPVRCGWGTSPAVRG